MWRCRIGRLIFLKNGLRTNKADECLALKVRMTSNEKTEKKYIKRKKKSRK